MNTVSKEVAIKLKKAGFDVPTQNYYPFTNPHHKSEAMLCDPKPCNHNEHHARSSAPDFLTAADWLWDEHGWCITFIVVMTSAETSEKDYKEFSELDSPDHRNEALLFALNQIQIKK